MVRLIWKPISGETPIDDISGFKVKGLRLRKELNLLEAENILKALEKYFTGRLTKKKTDVWTAASVIR